MNGSSRRLGALLLGAGFGLLLVRVTPPLTLLWPLFVIIVGVMVWRGLGTQILRFTLLGLALGTLLGGAGRAGFTGGVVTTTYTSSPAEAQGWLEALAVTVVNAVGDVTVQGGAAVPELRVVYERGRFGGGEVPPGLQVDYHEPTRTLTVTGVEPLAQGRRGVSARLELRLPEHFAVRVLGQVGDVRVADVAAADVQLSTGDIRLERVAGELRVRTNVGDIDIENSLGPIWAESNVGAVRVLSDRPLAADIAARTDVGDVVLSLPDASSATIRAVSQTRSLSGLERVTASEGRLRLGAGQAEVDLRTRIGRVEVRAR